MKIARIEPEVLGDYTTTGLLIVKGEDGRHIAFFPFHNKIDSSQNMYPAESEAVAFANEFIEKARAEA